MVHLGNIFDVFCIIECCSNYWVPNNMTELDRRLKTELMGQPLVHDLILKSLSSHISTPHPSKSLVLSLHGSTGTGKNFVAKHIVESLYRKGYKSKYVRLYVASRDFMHNDPEHLRQYKDRLTYDIERATSSCQQATFVFDEVDKMPIQLLDAVLFYIDFHSPTYAQPIDFRSTIFIFLSNTGGTSMIKLAQQFHLQSIKRENYNITEFQRALSNAAFNEQGGLWHASLIEKHLVTFFVPFLPLEREHVRYCIQRDLKVILAEEEEESNKHISEGEIIDRVLDLLEFAPPSTLLYSVSGCKKVQQKLNYVLETLRLTPPTMTKKPKRQKRSMSNILFHFPVTQTINSDFLFDDDLLSLDVMTSKQQQIDSLNSEIQILQKKLDSKSKAFAILINELDGLKHERDQFKSLVESLQEKCIQLKRQLTTKIDPLTPFHHPQSVYEHPNDTGNTSLAEKESTIHLLKTALKNVQDEKEGLQTKVDELTRELTDVKGDLSIFRQKRHRARVVSTGSQQAQSNVNDDSAVPSNNNSNEEQAILLGRLEQSNERIKELDNDLKLIVCQKEELEIERDSFKTKYSKLNQELNKMLNGDEKRVVDIGLVLSENRYLKEKINELIQEKNRAQLNATKYKDLLQTHRSAYNRLGKVQSSGSILTHKQVQSLLNQSYTVPGTAETENDLRSIAVSLFDAIKDKNVTIIHQRKTNKILANRVAELENLLATTSLSSRSDQTNSLINLLDRTPTPPLPDTATSQFVNSADEQQQTSPTQLFNFPLSWPNSPPPSNKGSDEENMRIKNPTKQQPTLLKNILACHQSTTTTSTRSKSNSIDLEMDDPLQSPTLAKAIAYLEETDLIPPMSRSTSITEHSFPTNPLGALSHIDTDQASGSDIEHLRDLLASATSAMCPPSTSKSSSTEMNSDRAPLLHSAKMTNSNSTTTSSAANLTC